MTASWLACTPVRIYYVLGLPITTAHGLKRFLLKWGDRVAGRFAHRVLCISHSLQRAALDERLFQATKIRVLAHGTMNGVDSAFWFNPEGLGHEAGPRMRAKLGIPIKAQVLGFVGRVVRDKGIVELVAAWRALRRRYPDMHLLVVGPFESEDPVPKAVKEELVNDPRTHLVGWVDDTRGYYATMNVLALPSYREGFPYVLLEAAAMAIPAVATQVPGCIDAVVDGVTGRLVPPYDARALTEAVAAYMDDPSLCRKHGSAAQSTGHTRLWPAGGVECPPYRIPRTSLCPVGIYLRSRSPGREPRILVSCGW